MTKDKFIEKILSELYDDVVLFEGRLIQTQGKSHTIRLCEMGGVVLSKEQLVDFLKEKIISLDVVDSFKIINMAGGFGRDVASWKEEESSCSMIHLRLRFFIEEFNDHRNVKFSVRYKKMENDYDRYIVDLIK